MEEEIDRVIDRINNGYVLAAEWAAKRAIWMYEHSGGGEPLLVSNSSLWLDYLANNGARFDYAKALSKTRDIIEEHYKDEL